MLSIFYMKAPKPIQPTQSLDLRGFSSPLMPLLVRQALSLLKPGQALEVWLASAQGAHDLSCILQHSGDQCLLSQALPDGFRLVLLRNAEQ